MTVLFWIAVGAVVWVMIAVAAVALLKVAKRADTLTDVGVARALGRPLVAPPQPALQRVAWAVRRELAVDQVLIVARDRRRPLASVVVAGVGVPDGLFGRSLEPRESVAAAVAVSGYAVIAPGQAPLDRRAAAAGGDSAAVPLAEPPGAVAVARLGAGQRLTDDDLRRLRTVLRRLGVACADAPEPAPQERRPARL